ncbi:MAG: hypothetical protein E6K59_09440 [Nitrospirae bacterium]|nr:MAG: hypothetical protein E6K59_09440 [Nitrospirota bacterium]
MVNNPKLKGTLFIILSLTVILLVWSSVVKLHSPQRPKYIFLNETDNHNHDLAFKSSLKLAEKRSGIENALILLKRLPPDSTIEKTAESLFQRWQIGRSRSGRGILYLYSEEENLFKIEVSYLLEGLFPDAICHRLEEAARTYMLSEISQDFISELLITMNLHGFDSTIPSDFTFSRPNWLNGEYLSGGAGVRSKGYRRTFNDYLAAVRRLPAAAGGSFEPSRAPLETVQRYLKSLELGLGDPQLPLLTQGSQVFRIIVPRNGEQQRRVFNYYQKAMPFTIYARDSLGAAIFKPGVPNLPIVLRRSSDGLWYIDEPKSWTYFHRFEDGIDFYPNYDDMPLRWALDQAVHPNRNFPIYQRRASTPEVIPYPFSLSDTIHQLEVKIQKDPDNDQLQAQLGEVYLFEINWISRSIEMFEKAAQLAPQNLSYRWRLFDLYINNSEVEKALGELKFISEKLPNDAHVQEWFKLLNSYYDFKPGEFGE